MYSLWAASDYVSPSSFGNGVVKSSAGDDDDKGSASEVQINLLDEL